MIDPKTPVSTPFRINWSSDPKVEYEFRTGVISSENGTEQRHAYNKYPSVSVSYETTSMSQEHTDRIVDMMPFLMTKAVAIRDLRINGSGIVSADGMSIFMDGWNDSWASGVRIVVEDMGGLNDHTCVIDSVDHSQKRIIMNEQVSSDMRGMFVNVGSAVSSSISGDMSGSILTRSVNSWVISSKSFRGVDKIGGAYSSDFPFSHGVSGGMNNTSYRFVNEMDFDVGVRSEFIGYKSINSGHRMYQVNALQMNNDDKKNLISFFCGCRGKFRSFSANRIDENGFFRFSSDILSVTHHSGNVSSSTLNITRIPNM